MPTVPAPVWAPWSTAARAADGLDKSCNFIFHIGHVGSTLLSRLLDEHPAVMSLREPPVLRTLAVDRFNASAGREAPPVEQLDRETDVFLRLLSRTWRAEQTVLIKATSFVSGIADRLLELTPAARAICLTVTPMAYIRGILGGPARTEAPVMAASRLERLSHRLGVNSWRLAAMSEGEVIAMSWLCEMTALSDAAKKRPADVLWFDFDQVLTSPRTALAAAFAHLGVVIDADAVQAIAASPILSRYSKAPDHAYSPEARREVLMQAEREHGVEVHQGVDWLRRAAHVSPVAKEVLIDAARIRLPDGAA
ncbi:MAG: hypothetical protein ACYDD1_11930 [Caulobacteraceae bacterium]